MFKKKEKRMLSEEEVKDLVDHLLRSAFQEQACGFRYSFKSSDGNWEREIL